MARPSKNKQRKKDGQAAGADEDAVSKAIDRLTRLIGATEEILKLAVRGPGGVD
jgi:hypothetical protein